MSIRFKTIISVESRPFLLHCAFMIFSRKIGFDDSKKNVTTPELIQFGNSPELLRRQVFFCLILGQI